MRRSCILVAALLVAAVPGVASAAVQVNIGVTFIPQVGPDALYTFEVFGTDLDGSNERLNAYTVAIDGVGFRPDGIRFVVPGPSFTAGRPSVNPYVFKDMQTIPPIENFGSTPQRLQFGATAIGQDDEVDIDPTHNGFLKFSVLVPRNTPSGVYPLVVDPRALSLAGLGAPIVAVPGTFGVVIVGPEPSAAALLVFPSLALLRRTRRGTPAV